MKKEITELLETYFTFTEQTGKTNLNDFSLWLHRNKHSAPVLTTSPSEIQTERDISYFINRLSRFSKFYSKKVLTGYQLSSIDDFYILLSIRKLNNPSKNDVYTDSITELTTGAQIMKRLIKAKLVTELNDPNDKRIKRVSLTAKGKRITSAIIEDFTETVKLKTGTLSLKEKESLNKLLRNLHNFHSYIYEHDSDLSVKELINKYIIK